jgi:Arc/MetJ-type ribon-helix-helix transcriptional regulator
MLPESSYAGAMGPDSTPEIEFLVEAIRAEGNYASRAEVVEAALQLLRRQQQRDAQKLFVLRSPKTRRQKWSIGLWAVKVLATIVAVIASAVDVESIVVTLPALTIAGLALVLLTRPLGSWKAFAYSLSGPLVSALCAALIAAFRWGTHDAQVPITTILFFYALYSIPAAIVIVPEFFRWLVAPHASAALPRQFSLKSLLFLTTGLCIALSVFGFVFRNSTHPDYLMFALFTLVTIGLVALAVTIFITDRHRQRMPLPVASENERRHHLAE